MPRSGFRPPTAAPRTSNAEAAARRSPLLLPRLPPPSPLLQRSGQPEPRVSGAKEKLLSLIGAKW